MQSLLTMLKVGVRAVLDLLTTDPAPRVERIYSGKQATIGVPSSAVPAENAN